MPIAEPHKRSFHRLYSDSADLQLQLTCYGNDCIEIHLVNQRYSQQLTRKSMETLICLCLYFGFCATTKGINSEFFNRNIIIDIAFLVYILHALYCITNLIKSEKVLFCLDFALQLQTEWFWSRRTNAFVSATNIHDVAVNEVIEDLDVHYILIVRTKGDFFKRKPIIPMFNRMRPSLDCLEFIYKHLNKVMQSAAH